MSVVPILFRGTAFADIGVPIDYSEDLDDREDHVIDSDPNPTAANGITAIGYVHSVDEGTHYICVHSERV